jgi:serine/threonine-protein kinase
VIFCTTELGQTAVEAFNRFGEMDNTKSIPAVLFVAEQHHQLAAMASTAEHRVLLFMPLKVRQLRTILLKLLSDATTQS